MYYTGHSPLCHLRKGISGSLRTVSVNEAHWERMCWPCFSPLAYAWMSHKSTRSPHHCMEKSHQSSKIEAEDFKFLRTEFDCLFNFLMLFSLVLSPFKFYFSYFATIKSCETIILVKAFHIRLCPLTVQGKTTLVITMLLFKILFSVILFEGK